MRIRIKVSMAGSTGAWDAGQTVDWPDAQDARRLIASGHAENAEPETAELPPSPRTAELPRPRAARPRKI